MKLSEQNILFFPRTMGLGGTENVVLQLCEIFKPLVNKIVVCSCGGVNVEKLTEMGIKHYTIADIASKNPKAMLSVYKNLKKIIKEEKITIVHSHHRMAALYARLVCKKQVLQIVNAHNTFKDKKFLTRFAYKKAKIIAVGEQVKNNLVDYFKIPQSKIVVIHNAIKPFDGNIQPISVLQKAKAEGYTLIGNVGRLSEQKGMEYFIQAAAIVYKTLPDTRFYIVGDGEDKDKLIKLSGELLPKGVLTFLGYRSDIQNVISQLDFIVLSSLWEGLPLTPIEAFSVKKTVIATAVDGTPEIVKDGENGLLVQPKNVQVLADKMIYLIEHPDKRTELENAAYESFVNDFSIAKMAEEYIGLFKSSSGECDV